MAAKKGRKLTKRGLVKKLDTVFSKYIRTRHADAYGSVACYTCGIIKHWKDMHCGHFISRVYYSTRWDEDNCKTQCASCNLYHQGQQYIFGKKLEQEIGIGRIEQMQEIKHHASKYSIQDYLDMIELYKGKTYEPE
jgi:hypothetical protein